MSLDKFAAEPGSVMWPNILSIGFPERMLHCVKHLILDTRVYI